MRQMSDWDVGVASWLEGGAMDGYVVLIEVVLSRGNCKANRLEIGLISLVNLTICGRCGS